MVESPIEFSPLDSVTGKTDHYDYFVPGQLTNKCFIMTCLAGSSLKVSYWQKYLTTFLKIPMPPEIKC